MSKIIISLMLETGQEFMLLPSWILFAQVMVGIMVTGPNYIEEKEHKTIDALRVSPLTLYEVIMAKGSAVLLFSTLSQLLVFILNMGFNSDLFISIPVMVVGGALFIQVGFIIGLMMNSSKTASAISSIVMVTLFLIASLYQQLPEWEYILRYIPSVIVVENLMAVFDRQFALFDIALLLLWTFLLFVTIICLVRKELNS
jgi:ABC-2 type transport system permease protein